MSRRAPAGEAANAGPASMRLASDSVVLLVVAIGGCWLVTGPGCASWHARWWAMGSDLFVRVLGPVEICSSGVWRRAGPAQQRLVLGVLAVRAGQIVPADELVDAAWDEEPPRSARNSVQDESTAFAGILAGPDG